MASRSVHHVLLPLGPFPIACTHTHRGYIQEDYKAGQRGADAQLFHSILLQPPRISMDTQRSRCTLSQRILEYRVGRDLKDCLFQPFLGKAESRQDVPAPCPAEVFSVGESTTSLWRLFQCLIVYVVKNFPHVLLESPQE